MYTTRKRTIQRSVVSIVAAGLSLLSALAIAAEVSAQTILDVPGQYPTIQAAIDAAQDGDTVTVADGTYIGAGNRDLDFGGKAITVGSANGAAACTIDCQASSGDPHRGFHFHSGETAASVLDGFTVQNGFMSQGGGLLCESNSSPLIRNCVFTNNQARPTVSGDGGGGIRNIDSSPTIVNCEFLNNQVTVTVAETGGGGMANTGGSPTITGCTFSANAVNGPVSVGHQGGGMRNEASSPILTACTFINNTSTRNAGGMVNRNGAQAQLVDCTFDGNQAADSGGAFVNTLSASSTLTNCTMVGNSAFFAAGMLNAQSGTSTVVDCTFQQNFTTGEDGGGYVINTGSSSIAINCRFIENTAVLCCGGMGINDGTAQFINCEFVGNSAGDIAGAGLVNNFGQAVFLNSLFAANRSTLDGGGLWIGNSSSAAITNGTFSQNQGLAGGGIRVGTSGFALVRNSVLWGDSPEGISVAGGTANVTYSDAQGGWPGAGNLDADPLFVSAPDPGPDLQWGTDDDDFGDLRLMPGSPCIDAGSNAAVTPDTQDLDGDANTAELTPYDLDGNPRFVDDPATADTGLGTPPIVDMGAYEFQPVVAVTILAANPPLDNPFVDGTQPFRDVLQTGTTPALTQGIGTAGTPVQDTVTYETVSVTFSGTPSPAPDSANVAVSCNGAGPEPCPTVSGVTGAGAGPYVLTLSGPIPPRNCTMLTFAGTSAGQKVQYQYLPGDMNFTGSVSASDINILVIALNNGQSAIPANLPRYNVNRIGSVSATDLARLVGLLNGVNTTQVWTGATVAACP